MVSASLFGSQTSSASRNARYSPLAVPYWTIRGTDPELIKVEGNDGPDDEKVVRRYTVDPKSGRID